MFNKFKKKIIYLILSILFVLILYSLVSPLSKSNKDLDPSKTIYIGGTFSKKLGLNPIFTPTSDNYLLFPFIFSSLIDFNEKAEAIGDVAEEWIISDDNKSITFKLKNNIFFHDGNPLTVKDVKWTYENMLLFQNTYYSFINRIEILNKTTIKFYFNRTVFSPQFYFNVSIVPAHLGTNKKDSDFGLNPVGSGHYIFSHIDKNENILLKRNENYYKNKGKAKYIYFKYYPNNEAKWSGFMRKEIDLYRRLSNKQQKIVKETPWCSLLKTNSVNYYIMVLDKENPFLNNKNVRSAIDMSIDRREIINTDPFINADEMFSPLPVNSPYFNTALKKRAYDPKKAITILHNEGFKDNDKILEKNGTPFILDLYTFNYCINEDLIAKIIKLQLYKIGVLVNIINNKNYEEIIEIKTRSKTPISFIASKPSVTTQLPFIYWLKDIDNSFFSLDRSDEYTNTYLDAIKTVDIDEKKVLFNKLQNIINDEKTSLFLLFPSHIYAFNDRLDLSGISIASYFTIGNLTKIHINKGGRYEAKGHKKRR
ncbi:MAG: hypothetical protein KAI43_00355 [Candidatus Aureabacteria bacterium]|nr:hypothetical protein [Candidatus Auribacterota bacterium]